MLRVLYICNFNQIWPVREVNMSSTEPSDVNDLREWLEALGLSLENEEVCPLLEQLRDGALLCQLVNRIRPGSVENVSLCTALWVF